MLDLDDIQDILDELAEELPDEFYKELNGGILLLPERKISSDAINNDLFVLGEYHHNYSMGRYIVIYYGSFEALYGNQSREGIKTQLRMTLRHEFTHHMESLGGLKDLEIEDERRLAKYRYKAHTHNK
jgi:hypothetical protein